MKTKRKLMASILVLTLLFGMISVTEVSAAKRIKLSSKKIILQIGEKKILKVKHTKKKVSWKVLSGKKYITLKKKGKRAVTITGRKKGTARVQAVVGKTKLLCKVTVKNAGNNKAVEPFATKSPAPSILPTAVQTPAANVPAATTLPTTTPAALNPGNVPEEKYADDVEALGELIRTQRERGATVSKDINSGEYKWEKGRLVAIDWYDDEEEEEEEGIGKNLQGDISFTPFTALEILECVDSELSSLDVSGCVNLTELYCSCNQLSSLDISGCVNLTTLQCFGNALSSLDVSACPNLKELFCGNNQLDSLDVSAHAYLEYIDCCESPLSSLDVSDCVNLTSLYCYSNQLNSLNVSGCGKLGDLYCMDNKLSSLDVSDCPNLISFFCMGNRLSSLDVSNCVNLVELWCSNNKLSSLDVSKNVKLDDLYCDDTVTVIGYKD